MRHECEGDGSEKQSRVHGICQKHRQRNHSLPSDVLSRLSKPKVRAENRIKCLENDTIRMSRDAQHEYMSFTALVLGREGFGGGGLFELTAEKVG